MSGQSFERTVTSSTAKVYVMPEGALYWYGNECEWITGGWGMVSYESRGTYSKDSINMTCIAFDIPYGNAAAYTNNKISNYNILKVEVTGSGLLSNSKVAIKSKKLKVTQI